MLESTILNVNATTNPLQTKEVQSFQSGCMLLPAKD